MSFCPCQSQNRIAREVSVAPGLGGVVGYGVATHKPPTLEEQHKAAISRLDESRDEARTRCHAVSLAVRASDGHHDDLLALATLFDAWQDARRVQRSVAGHVEAIESAMRAEKEAKSNG